MRKYLIVIFILLSVPMFAQIQTSSQMEGGRSLNSSSSGSLGVQSNSGNSSSSEPTGHPEEAGEGVKDSIKSRIYSWTLGKDFSGKEVAVLDTGMFNFHNYDPVFKKSISNTTLGYYGSAYISNIFAEREQSSDFYFLKSYDCYTLYQPDVKYFNTTTPYSFLRYTQGEENTNPELTFQAFFTQNIDPYTNFGFQFNTIKSSGHYLYQQGHHRFLNLFASRNKGNYDGYFSFIRSKNTNTENGGLSDPDNFSNKILADRLSVKLNSGTSSDYLHYSLFTIHEYKFEFPKAKADSLVSLPDSIAALNNDSIIPPSNDSIVPIANDASTKSGGLYGIEYMLKLDQYSRNYTETSLNSLYYSNFYTDSLSGYVDSISYRSITNRIQLKAYELPDKWFSFNARAYLENELVWAMHPIRSGMTTYRYSNVTVGGEISKDNGILGAWSGSARFVLLGRNLGDAVIKGSYDKSFSIFNDTISFKANARYQDLSANIFEEHLIMNRIRWENDFKKEHRIVLSAEAGMPDYKFSAGANYTMISNFLYNNELSIPDQYNSEFSILSAWADKKSIFGHWGWDNRIVWQALSDDSALDLPTWNIYSNFFFHHTLFKVMHLQIGTELFYNTAFYAPAYEPVTSQFYLQKKTLTGNYPLMNVYLNAKLKRASGFVKMYHFASDFLNGNYMSSPSYPLNDWAFRFGVIWNFYD